MRRVRALAPLLVALAAGCVEPPPEARSRSGDFPAEGPGTRMAEAARASRLADLLAAPPAWLDMVELEPGVPATVAPGDAGAPAPRAWVFELSRSAHVTLSVEGRPVASSLALFRGTPGRLRPLLATGTAGPHPFAADLAPGSYTVLDETGPGAGGYTVTLELQDEEEGPRKGGWIGGPGTRVGVLDGADPALEDGTRADAWTVWGFAGHQVTVTMASDSFDAHLVLLQGDGGHGRFLAEAVGAAGGPGARVSSVFRTSGPHTVLATATGPAAAGPYRLQVDTRPPPEPWGWDNAGPSDGRFALLVAAGDAPGDPLHPASALRDVRAVRELLVNHFGFHEQNVAVLTGRDATRENVANGILQHLGQAGPGGVAVFFHSGPGLTLDRDLGLLESGSAGAPGDRALLLAGAGGTGTLLLDEELDYLLASLDAGHALVVLETAFVPGPGEEAGAGAVEGGVRDVLAHLTPPVNFIGAEPAVTSNLSPIPLVPDTLRALSRAPAEARPYLLWQATGPDDRAWPEAASTGEENFTHHLVRLLAAAPGGLPLREVHRRVVEAVGAEVRSRGLPARTPVLAGQGDTLTVEAFFRRR